MRNNVDVIVCAENSPILEKDFFLIYKYVGRAEYIEYLKDRMNGVTEPQKIYFRATTTCRESLVNYLYSTTIPSILKSNYNARSWTGGWNEPENMRYLPYSRIRQQNKIRHLTKREVEIMTAIVEIYTHNSIGSGWWMFTEDSLQMSGTIFTPQMISFIFWIWEYFIKVDNIKRDLSKIVGNRPINPEEEAPFAGYSNTQQAERLTEYIIKTNMSGKFNNDSNCFWASYFVYKLLEGADDSTIRLSKLSPYYNGMSSYSKAMSGKNYADLLKFYIEYESIFSKVNLENLNTGLRNTIHVYKNINKIEKEFKDAGILSSEVINLLNIVKNPGIISGGNW